MNKFIQLTFFFLVITYTVNAQTVYPVNSPFNSIRQNGVSNILATGDTVWISPSLNYNVQNQADWFTPTGIDSITQSVGRIFSLDAYQADLVVGLGYSTQLDGESIPTGYGFYLSENDGNTWGFIDFPIDEQPPENCDDSSIPYVGECDIVFTYGGQQYTRIRNTVPQQSPPYDIQIKDDVILAAAWGSGLLRSTNKGQDWEKVILPPSNVSLFNVNNTYDWSSNYQNRTINRYDARSDLNLLGFGLHIAADNRVWFGSADGINISTNALTAPTDSISWNHINFSNTTDGLLGNWIIEIEENPADGKIWMTNWIIDSGSGEQFGIVATSDNGVSFEQHLIGEKINSIGFKDGAIFAAGVNGLFISKNNGNSWTKFPQIKSANSFLKQGAEFLSIASTNNRLWVGTNDGLISTNDLGETWEITRVNFPLSGGNAFDPGASTVSTYAYPNPFSPNVHDIVRLKFEVKKSGNVTVRIFDFAMNEVREIENDSFTEGTYEAVWDGVDNYGRNVANAPYIYVIEMADRTINGKILVVE